MLQQEPILSSKSIISLALKMIDMVACLIACVINFFLIDKVNEVQA